MKSHGVLLLLLFTASSAAIADMGKFNEQAARRERGSDARIARDEARAAKAERAKADKQKRATSGEAQPAK